MLTACTAPPSRNYSPSAPTHATMYPDVTHSYELLVNDVRGQPMEGVNVTFSISAGGSTGTKTKIDCITTASGICRTDIRVPQTAGLTTIKSYVSGVRYHVSRQDFYSVSGGFFSTYGSSETSNKDSLTKGSIILTKPVDYLSEEFLNSPADRELREQAIKFISLIRLQSLIVDADIMLRSAGTSSFKAKKYFQLKINTTTTYNSLKLDKYAVAKSLFDDSIRKILNPLNDNISDPRIFYGYDLTIYGYTKSFANKDATAEKVEYRFLIPQETVKRYKEKDISGQQLLDASVTLMNDERIDLKLQ